MLGIKEEGGWEYHRFPSKKLLSYSTKNCRRAILLCFRESLPSKNVEDKGAGGYAGITISSPKLMVSQYQSVRREIFLFFRKGLIAENVKN